MLTGGKAGALGDLEVGRVVCGRDLHRAGAERRVDRLVGDDRQLTTEDRKDGGLPDQVLVPAVGRTHRDTGVAQHRLDTGRRHRDVAAAVRERIVDVDEFAFDVGVLDLDVGEGRLATRAPIDDPVPSIDQALVVEIDEHFPHRAGEVGIHREALARPVDGLAQSAHLLRDGSSGLFPPAPHPLDERLAAEVVPRLPFLGQLALDDVLGCDAGVVRAREPERPVPLHASPADERVLDRVIERVSHVEDAGHVGRRQHDRERLAVTGRREVARALPSVVDAFFDAVRVVRLR